MKAVLGLAAAAVAALLCAPSAQAEIDDQTPLSQLRANTVIQVASRIPLTRGAFRQIFRDGRRQAGEYHYVEGLAPEVEKLSRWDDTCEIILHVSRRPQKLRPQTRLVVSDARVERGGVFLHVEDNDQVRAIRCAAKSPELDKRLTVGDLKRAFGAKLRLL